MSTDIEQIKESYKLPNISKDQEVYLIEYFKDFNAARAARAINLNVRFIRTWFNAPNFQRAIDIELDRRRAKNEVLIKETLDELKLLMLSDIRDFVEWEGDHVTLKASADMKSTKAIKAIEKTKNGVKLVMHDKVRSIELMMQGMGLIKKARSLEDEEKNKPTLEDEGKATTLLEALTLAHEERKALPQTTGGLIEVDQGGDRDVD